MKRCLLVLAALLCFGLASQAEAKKKKNCFKVNPKVSCKKSKVKVCVKYGSHCTKFNDGLSKCKVKCHKRKKWAGIKWCVKASYSCKKTRYCTLWTKCKEKKKKELWFSCSLKWKKKCF